MFITFVVSLPAWVAHVTFIKVHIEPRIPLDVSSFI